jgi:hypothetical protein
VAWSLENALQPTLERASEGLRTLTPADGERVIRLVVRRCLLNLIEIHPGRVDVHHWCCQGLADLRRFFNADFREGKLTDIFRVLGRNRLVLCHS